MRKVQVYKQAGGNHIVIAKSLWHGRRKTVTLSCGQRSEVKATIAKAIAETEPDQPSLPPF